MKRYFNLHIRGLPIDYKFKLDILKGRLKCDDMKELSQKIIDIALKEVKT